MARLKPESEPLPVGYRLEITRFSAANPVLKPEVVYGGSAVLIRATQHGVPARGIAPLYRARLKRFQIHQAAKNSSSMHGIRPISAYGDPFIITGWQMARRAIDKMKQLSDDPAIEALRGIEEDEFDKRTMITNAPRFTNGSYETASLSGGNGNTQMPQSFAWYKKHFLTLRAQVGTTSAGLSLPLGRGSGCFIYAPGSSGDLNILATALNILVASTIKSEKDLEAWHRSFEVKQRSSGHLPVPVHIEYGERLSASRKEIPISLLSPAGVQTLGHTKRIQPRYRVIAPAAKHIMVVNRPIVKRALPALQLMPWNSTDHDVVHERYKHAVAQGWAIYSSDYDGYDRSIRWALRQACHEVFYDSDLRWCGEREVKLPVLLPPRRLGDDAFVYKNEGDFMSSGAFDTTVSGIILNNNLFLSALKEAGGYRDFDTLVSDYGKTHFWGNWGDDGYFMWDAKRFDVKVFNEVRSSFGVTASGHEGLAFLRVVHGPWGYCNIAARQIQNTVSPETFKDHPFPINAGLYARMVNLKNHPTFRDMRDDYIAFVSSQLGLQYKDYKQLETYMQSREAVDDGIAYASASMQDAHHIQDIIRGLTRGTDDLDLMDPALAAFFGQDEFKVSEVVLPPSRHDRAVVERLVDEYWDFQFKGANLDVERMLVQLGGKDNLVTKTDKLYEAI
jgi:hypothetical protein